MLLRLDPAHPPVWRSETVMQFGLEPVAVLDDPAPWQLRVVRELQRGIPDAAFRSFAEAMGAPHGAAAERLRERLHRALMNEAPPRARAWLYAATETPEATRDAVTAGLDAAGYDVRTAHRFDAIEDAEPEAAFLVILAAGVVPPAAVAALMADDRPHIPVILTGRDAEIGPVVRPGATACLACVAAERRDRDPSWPVVAAQLIGHTPVTDPAVAWDAGVVAGRLLSEIASHPARGTTRSMRLRAGSLHRSVRTHRPHADCRCRSLAGIATAADPVSLVTRSATAYARPA